MKSNSPAPTVEVVVQMAADDAQGIEVPAQSDFRRWAAAASGAAERVEVCVRIVGSEESAGLNRRYRGRSGPTNVLSFPCDAPLPPAQAGEVKPLGDIVIAASVIASEARAQGKRVVDHWAHVFIHGMLHLQGYDHVKEEDARCMEEREAGILNRLGFANPYQPEFSGRLSE